MKLLKLVPDNTNIQFLKWRMPFYVVSLLLMAASLTLVFTKGLNLGVDFVGGQMIRVTFEQTPSAPVAELRSSVGALGYGEPTIQTFGGPNEVSIRMKLPEGSESDPAIADAMAREITTAIQAAHPDARIDGVDSVSGKVSGELFKSGMQALFAAMVAISIYIWFRFEWQFAVAGIATLLLDTTKVVGLMVLTGIEFNLTTVAAILTIIGFNANDKVVVYDRVRENLKKFRRMPLPELLDLSVNETLSRTVVTSLSLLITLLALLLLGPSVIFGFTAAITVGIFVGTYSSIFMSTPILIWLKVTGDSFVPTETEVDRQERLARERG
jgi:preprotein translocase subunit SecF